MLQDKEMASLLESLEEIPYLFDLGSVSPIWIWPTLQVFKNKHVFFEVTCDSNYKKWMQCYVMGWKVNVIYWS